MIQEDSAPRAWRTTFSVPGMDCPSEETVIRMALQGIAGVQHLRFDLPERQLTAVHEAPPGELLAKLAPLGFGARVVSSEASESIPQADRRTASDEASVLWVVLSINAFMFVVELAVGMLAQSTGLIADSLDMLADALVYGLALFAVGRPAIAKRRAAHAAGWLQLALALGALFEVGRRFLQGSEPASLSMMATGFVALLANIACLVLVAKKADAGAHMKASYIFTATDVIANAGVIAAGALVWATGSRFPDLFIGFAVALVVLNGAIKILRLK